MTSFTAESWIWYGFVMPVVLLRFISKYTLRRRSEPMLFVEDWLMVFSACLYTALTVLYTLAVDAPNNYVRMSQVADMSIADIRARERGGKLNMACEVLQNTLEWTVKGCLLLLYTRVFKAFGTHVFIIITAVYVVLSYIIQQALYFGFWCDGGLSGYWQVPPPNLQCAFPTHHMILNVIFNVTSDLMILAIPIPLLWGDALPLKRKFLLVVPLSMGVFTIFAAIICKVESLYLRMPTWWGLWCIREAAMIMIAANMPYVWGLLRRFFRGQDSADLSYKTSSSDGTSRRTSEATVREKEPWKVISRSMSSFTSSLKQTTSISSNAPTSIERPLCSMEHGSLFKELTWHIDGSSPQHVRKPSVAAIAVDKLYRLDTKEVESYEDYPKRQIRSMSTPSPIRRHSQASTRKQSTAAIAVDKLYRMEDIEDEPEYQEDNDSLSEQHPS